MLWDTVVRHRDVHRRSPQVTLCDANHNSTVYVYFSLVLINVSQKMEVIRVCLCWHTQTIINGRTLIYCSHRLTMQCTCIHMMCRIFLMLVCQSTYFLSPLLSSPLLFSPLASTVPSVPSIWKGIVEQAWQRAAQRRQRCWGRLSTAGRDSYLFVCACVWLDLCTCANLCRFEYNIRKM